MSKQQIFVAIGLVLGAILIRLLPHAPNFAPIGAVALAAGIYLPRRLGILIPIAAMLVTDFLIGFYNGPVMISVYGSFVVIALLNSFSGKKDAAALLGRSMSGAVLFFGITNFAVWAFGTMYPHTLSGLLSSFAAGIPFFRNTLASDMFYSFAIVGIIEFCRFCIKKFQYLEPSFSTLQKEPK